MNEYEVLVETINPCGGERHSIREIIEIEAESPEAYVREHGRWPITDIVTTSSGDTIITTGDCAGNIIRYTFSE